MTGLTAAECMALLPHFEPALVVYLRDRTIAGQPRTSRRYRSDDNGPLPTIADNLLLMLTYLQQHPNQAVQDSSLGCLNRMRTKGFICCLRC